MPVINVHALDEVDKATASCPMVVLYFWASWCEPCVQMDAVVEQLAVDQATVSFMRVEAEVVDSVTEKYEVTTVPCFLVIKNRKVCERVEGADPPALTAAIQRFSASQSASPTPNLASASTPAAEAAAQPSKDQLIAKCKALLSSAPVMLFMKGSAAEPRCGFSRKVVDALKAENITFSTFDILQDEGVRQALKELSNWPTYPQLYVKGELLGGCDIVLELAGAGELRSTVDEMGGLADSEGDLDARIKGIISSQPVMLFMKGDPAAARCGFSSKVVTALRDTGIEFGTFDILKDEAVRQRLKEISNWPTYPQLFVNGELVGGCDIIEDMAANGQLKSTIEEMMYRL